MMEIKKIFAVCMILLFIGVVITPSINLRVVKAFHTDNNLVEVTTQACGIQGYGNTTVKLTREQHAEVDLLFETIHCKLNNAASREEFVHIYHDAIIELDKYGLLPQGLTIEQAQNVVTRWNQNHHESIMKRQLHIFPQCVNAFCLLSLTATRNSYVYPLLASYGPLWVIAVSLSLLSYRLGASKINDVLVPLLIILSIINPFKLMNLIMIRGYYTDLYSVGLKGNVNSDDVFLLVGYTGLMVFSFNDKIYFLGSALAVVPEI